MKYLLTLTATLYCAVLFAQVTTTLPIDTAEQRKKGKTVLSVGTGGVKITKDQITVKGIDSIHRPLEVQFGMLDLGINSLVDKTEYGSGFLPGIPSPQDLLQVPWSYQNRDLFSLRQGKSINVNIYPVMLKANLIYGRRQKLMLATGLGLQLYNFRFNKPISYQSDPSTHIILDSVSFSKNKLAFNYLTVPLMLNAKTRLGGESGKHGYWLVYGAGVSGGYLLSSWTKQISDERGKQKNHDDFNFRKTNLCVNGEIGLDGYFRLYASYQLTALHESGPLQQHPFSIGLRFLGL